MQRISILVLLALSIYMVEGLTWTWGNNMLNLNLEHLERPGAGEEKDPACVYRRANNDPIEIELERLHRLARRENRTLQSLEGGDETDDMDGIRDAFQAKFPCISVNLSIDLSKYHDVRIDEALKDTTKPFPYDLAHLQTVHDFYRWKREGHLLKFKPAGYEYVFEELKDKEGHFVALNLITFSHYTQKNTTNKPRTFQDYLNPRWKGGGKIVLTYPHDDDAVLYQLYLAMKQDPKYVEKLVAQEPRWVRGTGTPYILIDQNIENATVTFSVAGVFNNSANVGQFTLPGPPEPFLTWGQLAAIFKRAPSPNTAKLYMTWWLSRAQQKDWIQWSSRWDVNNDFNKSNQRLVDYPNTKPENFIEFMKNRKLVNELIDYMNRVIGPVQGESPLSDQIRN